MVRWVGRVGVVWQGYGRRLTEPKEPCGGSGRWGEGLGPAALMGPGLSLVGYRGSLLSALPLVTPLWEGGFARCHELCLDNLQGLVTIAIPDYSCLWGSLLLCGSVTHTTKCGL